MITSTGWESKDIVALIPWIPNLTKTSMPFILRDTLQQGLDSLGRKRKMDLLEIDSESLAEVAQWSDLIIFDYLTGNYDRVASMQVNNLID